MGYNPAPAFTVGIASGLTLSSQVDLGRGWDHITLEVPTMASGCDIFVQGSNSNSGTFRRFYHRIAEGTDNPTAMNLNSSVTNCLIQLEFVNTRYVKVELSTAMTATSASFAFVCS